MVKMEIREEELVLIYTLQENKTCTSKVKDWTPPDLTNQMLTTKKQFLIILTINQEPMLNN
jgi:hypothetical protein